MAFTKAKRKNKSKILKINQTAPGIKSNGYISIGDNHPPKNKIEPIAHIKSIFAYSPSQNIAYILSLIHI